MAQLRTTTLRLATTNRGKLLEFQSMLQPLNISVKGIDDIPAIEVKEDGDTFIANATLKAHAYFKLTGEPTLADDSGLVVDALDGAPGIYSARYAGIVVHNGCRSEQDTANRNKLLQQLAGRTGSKRTAKFVCALVYYDGKNPPHTFYGEMAGYILEHEQGDNGFGYDSIFAASATLAKGRSNAQLLAKEKNVISHRHHALIQFVSFWKNKQ